MKKVIACFIACLMIFASLSFSASAEGGVIYSGDIDWSAESIVVSVSADTLVSAEVFNRIINLPQGKTVEFKSAYGSIFVPTGVYFEALDGYVSVGALYGGDHYEDISSTIDARTDYDIDFKAFAVISPCYFPEGTKISFNLGDEFAGKIVDVLDFNYFLSDLTRVSESTVSETGVTEMIAYNNESVIVCSAKLMNEYAVSVTVNGEGGSATPEGIQTVFEGESVTISFKADEGYVIKRVLKNGEEFEINADSTEAEISFTVTANSVFSVEFEKKAFVPVEVIVEKEQSTKPEEPQAEEKTAFSGIALLGSTGIIIIVVAAVLLLFALAVIIIIIIIIVAAKKKKKRKKLAAEAAKQASEQASAVEAEEAVKAATVAEVEAEEPEVTEAVPADVDAQPEEETKLCAQCGANLSNNDAFCSNCGAKQ